MQAPGIIFPALVTCSRETQAITVWDLGNAGPDIAPVRTIRESIGDIDAIAVYGSLCAVLAYKDITEQYDVMVFDLSK